MRSTILFLLCFLLSCIDVDDDLGRATRPAGADETAADEPEEIDNDSVLATVADRVEIVQVNVDDVLKKATITRPVRSSSILVSRMQTLVGQVYSGGTFRPGADLTAWAVSANGAPGKGASLRPLTNTTDVRVHYEPYFDDLLVENMARVTYRPDPIDQPIDYGIGQAAAMIKANATVSALETAGILSSAWGGAPVRTYSVRREYRSDTAGQAYAYERVYMFVYRRSYQGFPVLDAKLEVGIGAHESPAKVASIRLGDITVAASTPDTQADITTDGARTEFLVQTDVAEDPSPDEIVIAEEFVGYMLDPRNTTGAVYPRFHASYETLTGQTVSLGKGASLSFTEIPLIGGFERQLHFPWDGASPSPASRPNGTQCIGNNQCSSGKCFFAGEFGGICGACSSDVDCPTNKVCDHPRLIDGQWIASACVTPAPGKGCSSATRCGTGMYCESMFYSPSFYNVRVCSACFKDTNCPGGKVCAPSLDLLGMTAKYECITTASRALGELCKDQNECQPGLLCAGAPIGDLGSVGVCSECDDDLDCTPDACTEATASIFGFTGGVCE